MLARWTCIWLASITHAVDKLLAHISVVCHDTAINGTCVLSEISGELVYRKTVPDIGTRF